MEYLKLKLHITVKIPKGITDNLSNLKIIQNYQYSDY